MRHAFLLTALIATAAVQANPTIETNGVLTNRDGRTLYTFDKDSENKSNCNGDCLAAWAFRGKPLYFFSGDARPGERNGDNQGGVWHALRTDSKKTVRNENRSPSAGYSYTY